VDNEYRVILYSLSLKFKVVGMSRQMYFWKNSLINFNEHVLSEENGFNYIWNPYKDKTHRLKFKL